jgi:O-antigen/teichoic acid export membrane protein
VLNAVINTVLANGVRLAIMLVWAKQGRLSGIAGLEAIAWGSFAALIPACGSRALTGPGAISTCAKPGKLWNFGRWAMGGTIANWVAVEFYPILTAGLIAAAAGAYRALQNLVAPVHMLLRATDTFLTPRAANIYEKEGQRAGTHFAPDLPNFRHPHFRHTPGGDLIPRADLRTFYGDTYAAYSSGMVLMAIFYALLFAYYPLQTIFKASRLSTDLCGKPGCHLDHVHGRHLDDISGGVNGTIAGQALNALVVNLILWGTWIGLRRKT